MNFWPRLRPAFMACAFPAQRMAALAIILFGIPTASTAVEIASVSVGSKITFQASAEGTPAPTFQWKKNGIQIIGATGPAYEIGSVSAGDAGTYRVTASNQAGSADSSDITLEVIQDGPNPNTPPSITAQPTAPTGSIIGDTVQLAVTATGYPTPTYQWKKDGVAVAGATNATLILANITAGDAASYSAVATNVAGAATSNSATLVISSPPTPNPPPPPTPSNLPPSITSQPAANQNVTVGATATFLVAASGTPTPTFQWQKNGAPISGATNATLTIANATTSDSATYLAIASNSAGSVVSNPSVLIVTTVTPVTPPAPPPQPPAPPPAPPISPSNGNALAPAIITQPTASQTALAGTSLQLTVVVDGNPAPTIQWRKNGTSIPGATTSVLGFVNLTTADAATYSVLATNSAGTAVSQNAIVIVNSRPVFSTQPAAQAVPLGARAAFTTIVAAIPGASLQWRKDGVALPGATRPSLTIDSVTPSDLGVYSVVATNTLGMTVSADAPLVPAAPPIITTQPTSQTAAARSDVTFFASASGGPDPAFQWKKDGASIPGATTATLTLQNVDKIDEGLYSVVASNTVGFAVSNRAALVVTSTSAQGQPGATEVTLPTNPAANKPASRIVNLSVRAKAGGPGESLIVGFVINGPATKPMLIRGIGPALGLFGLSDSLSDPTLSLYSGSELTAANDDWLGNANAAQILAESARLGAFALPNAGADAALLTALEAGAYTVQLKGKGSNSGVALVEVYDAAQENPSNLVNLSVRTYVGNGADAPNLGFVVAGTGPKRMVIRAVGPTLAAFGVPGVISDPQLELYRGNIRIDQNDNWGGSVTLGSTFDRIGAFALQAPESRDAALLVSLDPGAYTVVVSGVGGSAGVALVEVYDVQ